jgi:light-regulated signal transduction histidine kinase (bacteriophytochrome)
MDNELGIVCAEGFSVFGRTCRLISHELKNVLAIISETSGLLDELVDLADSGRKFEPGKLQSQTASILEEVERANKIIRNMNTFAHSVDEFIGKVDIGQTLALMSELCQLDSSLRKTKLHLIDSEPCVIYTSHFFLANLIYEALNFSLLSPGPNNEIRISFDSNDDEVRIIFSGIATRIIGEFPTKRDEFLGRALSGEVSFNAAAGELVIVLPVKIDETCIHRLIFSR